MPELDEFGIPKKTAQVDEFGIPVKKKESGSVSITTSGPSSQSVSPSQSVSDFSYAPIEQAIIKVKKASSAIEDLKKAPTASAGIGAPGIVVTPAQTKAAQDAYLAAQKEQTQVLAKFSKDIFKPIESALSVKDGYKQFFDGDVFDRSKAATFIEQQVAPKGGGKYVKDTLVAELQRRAQADYDKPEYQSFVNQELKKSGINMQKYGEQTFKKLSANQQSLLPAIKQEAEKEVGGYLDKAKSFANTATMNFNTYVEDLNAQIKAGQIDEATATKLFNEKKAEYDTTVKRINDDYQKMVRNINVKVNQRFGRVENELKKISGSITNEQVFENIPAADRAKIEDAYKRAALRLAERKNKDARQRDAQAGSWGLAGKSLVSGFNSGLASFGGFLAMQGYDNSLVNWLQNRQTEADKNAPAKYNWNGKEWVQRAITATGQSVGASAPLLVPTALVGLATGGASIPTSIGAIATGLTAYKGESMQIAGDVYNRKLAETGDVNAAQQAAERVQEDNVKTMPFYFLGGLGVQNLVKGKGLRSLAVGGLLEQAEEIPTEYIQSYNEAKVDGYNKGIGQFIKDNPEIAYDTVLATAGQAGAFKVIGKAYSTLTKETSKPETQFYTDLIKNKGFDFANQVLQKYYDTGVINEQQFKTQQAELAKVNQTMTKLSETGIQGDQAQAMAVVAANVADLKRKVENEKDPAVKSVFQNQLAEYEEQLRGIPTGQTSYIVLSLPGNDQSTRIITVPEYNRLKESGKAKQVIQAADTVKVVNDDALNTELQELKTKVGIPAGAPEGAYAGTEVSNIDNIEAIKSKFPFIKDEDFVEQSYTVEEDKEFRDALPDAGITEQEFTDLLNNGEFAMLTGMNPEATPLSKEANNKLNEEAQAWLASRGLKPIPIYGKYSGNSERSFIVPDMTKKQAVEFAKAFSQDSVAHSSGLVYKDGKSNPRVEGINKEDRFDQGDDFFSTVNLGGKKVDFSINYDFDTTNEADAKSNIADEILTEVLGKPENVQASVDNVAKALKSTGVQVEVVENDDVIADRTGGQRGIDGIFVDEEGKIYLSKNSLENSIEANRIVFHEGAHPVMNIIRNTNRPLYDKVVAGLKAAAADNQEIAASLEWAQSNYEAEYEQDDEAIIETIGKIADSTLDIESIPTGLKQSIIDFINLVAKALGLGQIINDTDIAAFKKLAGEIANALATGQDVADIVGAENVTQYQNTIGGQVGPPTQLRFGNVEGESVKVKGEQALSFVTEEDLFDIMSLVKDIQTKKQKVWFWVADQLGRGFYYDGILNGEHYLDAGPSFALDPENREKGIIWATGKGEKWINDKIANSDYIFIISGSPSKSKLFNKRVAELTFNRIKNAIGEEGTWDTFKNEVLAVSKIGKINSILNEFNSFEELLESPKRKDLLIEFDNQKEKKGTPLKALLEKYNALIDYEELRDGFYKNNDFKQNDIMLVLKPTEFGGVSKHSTYENDLLGEVVGVPDKKVNAFDLMPDDFKAKYDKELSRTEQSQAVAPYGVGIRGVQARKSGNLVEQAKLDKKMAQDGQGNYVFYHYSAKKFSKVDPNKFGSNTSATGRDERPGMGISMFYTRPTDKESMVSGENGYIARVPMDKVYPFNADPLNFYDEAKEKFEKQFPGQAFEPNKQVAFITQVANENGYPMTVAKWNGRLRAQTTEALAVEPLTEEAKKYKSQARKSNLEQSKEFKLAAYVMRKKAEGADMVELVSGINSVFPSMKPQEIKDLIDNPDEYINKKFAYLSADLRSNLIGRAKAQNIYTPIPRNEKAGVTATIPMDKIYQSLKENKIEKFKEAVKDWGKKWMTASKGLPDWVLSIKDMASGTKNFEVDRAARILGQLKADAKKIGFTDWDAFSKAMVSLGNQPVRQMSDSNEITGFDAGVAAAGRMFTTPDDMLPATVPQEIKDLPDEIIPYVYQMRATIDKLTKDLVTSGYVTPEQAAVLEKNVGQYVNRAYKMYNEKGYAPSKEILADAVQFLANQKLSDMLVQNPTGNMDAMMEEAITEAKKSVDAILNKKKNPYFNAKTESRNTGILQERENIPEPIRKLMGEYTDPGTVFIMTVAKQAALKASSEFLTKLREKGMGTIFYEKSDPNRPTEYSVQIAAEGSDTKAPLNGLYTTPQVAEALETVDPTYNELTSLWMKAVGAVRWGKTVGSVVTQFKNFESNLGFAVMNGLMFTGKNTQAFKGASKYIKGQYSKGEVDALTEKAMKLGLVGQSVGARELASMLGSGDIHDVALDLAVNPKSKYRKVKEAVGMPFEQANKLYKLGDDFWKVYGYMNEREQLAKALFGGSYETLTPQQQEDIDTEAAERVKSTWPTYDRIFEAAKYINKRAPIFGNFISFQAESLRVLANTIQLANTDMSSDNPEIQALGMRRMFGVATYVGFRAAATYAMAKAAGIAGAGILAQFAGDDEEKEKKRGLNKAMPSFMRTGDLLTIQNKKEPHRYTVYNMSSIDPYGTIPNALNALTEGREGVFGKNMDPGVLAGVTEFFSGFMEPEMTFETTWSVLNNANMKTGDPIVLPTDNNGEAVAKISKYMFDQLQPSTIAMIERLIERDNKSAELSAMAGARPYDVDLHKSFRYGLSDMLRQLEDINKLYNPVNYSSTATPEQKLAAKQDAETSKARLIKQMNETYNDFIKLGAEPKILNEMVSKTRGIKSTGFDLQTKNGIKSGKFDEKKLYKIKK